MIGLASFGMGLGRGSAEVLMPTTPTISLVSSTNSVTVTIAGDAGVTNYLVYKKSTAASWTAGGSRSGDGDITVSDLDYDCIYIFGSYSVDAAGTNSQYAIPQSVTLAEASDDQSDIDASDIASADAFLAAFGEPGTYLPRGGGERAITIIVDRDGNTPIDGVPSGNSGYFLITVKNSATEGISSTEIDTGGDKIKFANRIGKTATNKSILKIVSQDAGMIQLEARG